MKALKQFTTRPIRAALAIAALAAAYALPATAVTIPFSQTVGWFMGPPTAVLWTNNDPQAGGVEFFGPLPASPAPPPSTFTVIGWGCNFNDITSCAAYSAGAPPAGSWPLDPNTAILATTLTDPRTTNGTPERSALEVTGSSGNLDDVNWTDITTVKHYNHVINGNALSFAQVQGILRLNGQVVDIGGVSMTNVDFTETNNNQLPCNQAPVPGAPVNPLGTQCDDFAVVSGLDLSPIPIPNSNDLNVRFRLNVPANIPGNQALVCPSPDPVTEATLCNGYADPTNLLVYTGEKSNNTFSIQAQLFSGKGGGPGDLLPLFVIGDCEYDQSKLKKNQAPPPDDGLREVGNVVNFWGSQWWKNNCMSGGNDNGYPAFKGYATNAVVDVNQASGHCGVWQARPGNSGNPPDTIDTDIAVIVTDRVNKQGPNIGGIIKQIVIVHRNPALGDNYAGNPGHQGWGSITSIPCTPPAQP